MHAALNRFAHLLAAVTLCAFVHAACTPAPPADAVGSPPTTAAHPPSERSDQPKNPASDFDGIDAREDHWMVCYAAGTKVGYTHLRIEPVTVDGQPRLRYSYEDRLAIQRFGQTTVIQTRLTSTETIDGRIVEFRSEILTGPQPVVTTGKYEDGALAIQIRTNGKTEDHRIPWEPGWGGFFADQQSLRTRPMRPRETRRLKALLPVINQVAEIRMHAAGYEAVELPSGTRQLLRIDQTTDLGVAQLKTIIWTDQNGRAWKTRDLQLGLEAFRATKESAMGDQATTAIDLGHDVVVRVQRRLADPHHTRRIVYRAKLTDGDIRGLFAPGITQTVKLLDDHTAEVTVRAVRPDQPARVVVADGDRPGPSESKPSAMIQSDDERIVAMAREGAAGQMDPWKTACALERYVHQKIRLKNYSTAMATAAEVARSLEGDCTEHAMLLAALCRARGIPARVAIGLVYYPADRGFAYHMWTEAWIKNRWIPLDATLGLGGTGAAHLKFAHSAMTGTSGFAELLPVIKALGRLELEILEVD